MLYVHIVLPVMLLGIIVWGAPQPEKRWKVCLLIPHEGWPKFTPTKIGQLLLRSLSRLFLLKEE